MKNLAYAFVLLICGTAMAQEKPKEVKEEATIKTIKYNDGQEIKEKKVKVVTRETTNVKLDENDAQKVNQERLPDTKKVEKMVMVSGDPNTSYELLLKETNYISEDKNYKFTPSDKGFDISFDNNNNEFEVTGKAWNSSNKGSYLVKGDNYNGVGYFNTKGEFVVEYYDEDSQSIKTMTYKEKEDDE
ncbi:hypothetical protein [Algibacter sp. 2305UL17-15]|uniref:hypothetical protein n=1 Tax=Algibacter sp. 2305UL17-15 TaxID=3231268 RepID=UPI003458C72D